MTVLIPRPVSASLVEAGPWRAAWPTVPSALALPPRPSTAQTTVGSLVPGVSTLGAAPPVYGRQTLSLRAGMAELVLLNRLRARTRRELDHEMLERAARVIGITARYWAGESSALSQD